MYDGDHILTTGKYRFTALKRVPFDYLEDVYKSGCKDKDLLEYIEKNVLGKQKEIIPEPLEFPCTKFTYLSKKEANADLNRILKVIKRDKKPIRSYQCDKCGFWHITSMEKYD
jgi:hypothetical protein